MKHAPHPTDVKLTNTCATDGAGFALKPDMCACDTYGDFFACGDGYTHCTGPWHNDSYEHFCSIWGIIASCLNGIFYNQQPDEATRKKLMVIRD